MTNSGIIGTYVVVKKIGFISGGIAHTAFGGIGLGYYLGVNPLQAIYEYQTVICELTGLEVSNASLYDGGTALYEAAMMAVRLTGRKKIIVDSGVSLIYRTMLYTYTSNLSIEFVETPVAHGQSCREDIYKNLDDRTAAVIMQNPNFFGAVDDFSDIVKRVHASGALAIASVYPVSLGMLKSPGEMGFDIATGEGQNLARSAMPPEMIAGIQAAKQSRKHGKNRRSIS